MNWLDAIILVVLAIPVYAGFKRGLASTFFLLAAVVAGIAVSGLSYHYVSTWFTSWLSNGPARIAAFVLVFILFITGGVLLLKSAAKLTRLLVFGWGGLTRTALPVGGIVLGLAMAGLFHGNAADWLLTWLESEDQARIIAFLVIFVFVIIASTQVFLVVSSFSGRAPHITMEGWPDRVGGCVLGLAAGAVISGAVLSLVAKYDLFGMQSSIAKSAFAALFLDYFPFVLRLLPADFDTVRQFFK
ncbi:MAG: CvpA family protein [Dehalococcoidia bacterium]|nr:CvpA family protein [Dehalococcoidia bacterium]